MKMWITLWKWWIFLINPFKSCPQKVCSKKVSDKINGDTYFHYGGYYQLIAAVLSLFALLYYGFGGFNGTMLLCSVGMAAFITLGLFSEIQALKGASLILVQMFDMRVSVI